MALSLKWSSGNYLNQLPASAHFYKYRLFFGRNGRRLVGFDNERGKGDHCHLDGREVPYHFTGVDQLVADFLAEVAKRLEERQE